MSSESSLLGGMPPSPTLRRSTSAPIISVMTSSSPQASTSIASSSRPYQRERVSMKAACSSACAPSPRTGEVSLLRLREERLQLRPGLGALADDAVPAGLVGLGDVDLGNARLERDRLHPARRLALRLLLILRRELCRRFLLAGGACLAQHVLLRVGELVPGRLVDQHRHLGGVEAGIDAVLGLLVPAEVEHAGDRPAVAVDHAALERGVDLARRRLHYGGAERLEEVAVDRRDAQLEAGQVGLLDRLVKGEVERNVVGAACSARSSMY